MRRVLNILRKFGGAALVDALPSKTEFEERLQKNTLVANDLEARLKAIDVDIGVSARRPVYHPRRIGDNEYN